jgi:hypothetical protein
MGRTPRKAFIEQDGFSGSLDSALKMTRCMRQRLSEAFIESDG